MAPLLALLAVPVGLIVLMLVMLAWSSQDFANRCERAGGVLVNYEVCLTKDSHVLMTSD